MTSWSNQSKTSTTYQQEYRSGTSHFWMRMTQTWSATLETWSELSAQTWTNQLKS